MTKTANLALRISPDLKAALEAAAKSERRTVSNFVEVILASHLQERGLLSKAA